MHISQIRFRMQAHKDRGSHGISLDAGKCMRACLGRALRTGWEEDSFLSNLHKLAAFLHSFLFFQPSCSYI